MTQQSFNNIVVMDGTDSSDEFFVADGRAFNAHLGESADVLLFGADNTGVRDSTQAFIDAVNACKTIEYTEAIPTQGAVKKLIIPGGRYMISAKINIPSYINVVGDGRHTTIIDSYITNGDPVFEVAEPGGHQQFLNSLQGFTINGGGKNCIGIKIKKTSRWVLRDVSVDGTESEGLYISSSFLGELYSCQIRACGDATHAAVLLTNEDGSGGSHAVTFFGGELNGGNGTSVGLFLNTGTSVSLYGTTIEGFRDGYGIKNNTGNSFTVSGCYFEENKGNIVEVGNTLGSNYINNFLGVLAAGAPGHIGITYAQGATIEGNYYQGVGSVKIFDATADASGKLQISYIRDGYSPTFPINISASLLADAKIHGTIIEYYDGNKPSTWGTRVFQDVTEFISGIKATGGLVDIGGKTRTNLTAGAGSPEGVVTADPSSIYLREDGDRSNSVYLKAAGVNNNTAWLPMQGIQAGSTASRPVVATAGYMYFDATLGKPIWWNGALWKDATGATV
jgi:hypothetical protein